MGYAVPVPRLAARCFTRARIKKIDIEGDAHRTVQNRRHSTVEDEINLCPDQRRNDLSEINGHRSYVSAFCQRASTLPLFPTLVSVFRALLENQLEVFAQQCAIHIAHVIADVVELRSN
jgi:hypothetical protein